MIAALGDEIHHFAQPIDRHGNADEAEDHQQLVEPAAARGRRNDADEHAEDHPQDRRADHQRQRHRNRVEHRRHDFPAAIDEGGQIAGDEDLLHHDEILHVERLIEAKALAHRLEHFRARHCGPAMREAGIGARRREEDQEHQHADAEHHKEHLSEALQQGEKHQPPPQPDLGARIKRVAQAVAQHIERQHATATMAMPGASATHGPRIEQALAILDDGSPARIGRLHADRQEGQSGFGQHVERHHERHENDERGRDIGQDVAQQNAVARHAKADRREHEFAFAQAPGPGRGSAAPHREYRRCQ